MVTTAEASMPDSSKHFVLPYEPGYTAHRTDDYTRRVTELHLKARELMPGPSLVPGLGELGGADETDPKPPV
jgi:hypothetical protein